MTLFKKKIQPSTIQALLYERYKYAREDGKKYFYYALFDKDRPAAEDFCRKNHIRMFLDHSTDGNLIYKFVI